VTAERSTFSVRGTLWTCSLFAAMFLESPGCSTLPDLIPGHKEAQFRSRVQNDSFPTAAQATQLPAGAPEQRVGGS
jgi:hypothetical protein